MNNEQNEKMGKLICEQRKLKKLTQKELAQLLNVTDKAVSKWERGISCPDTMLLIPLAKILEITTGELLTGEKTQIANVVEETAVEEAILYSGRSHSEKVHRIRKAALAVTLISFILGAAVCFICDICINQKFTWSLIVGLSLLFAFLLIIPFCKAKEHIIKKVLLVLTIGVIPYLFLLSIILKDPIIIKLGAFISLISIIGVWCVYAVWIKLKQRKFLASGVSCFVLLPVTIAFNNVISIFVKTTQYRATDNYINIISLLAVGILCFALDYIGAHRR